MANKQREFLKACMVGAFAVLVGAPLCASDGVSNDGGPNDHVPESVSILGAQLREYITHYQSQQNAGVDIAHDDVAHDDIPFVSFLPSALYDMNLCDKQSDEASREKDGAIECFKTAYMFNNKYDELYEFNDGDDERSSSGESVFASSLDEDVLTIDAQEHLSDLFDSGEEDVNMDEIGAQVVGSEDDSLVDDNRGRAVIYPEKPVLKRHRFYLDGDFGHVDKVLCGGFETGRYLRYDPKSYPLGIRQIAEFLGDFLSFGEIFLNNQQQRYEQHSMENIKSLINSLSDSICLDDPVFLSKHNKLLVKLTKRTLEYKHLVGVMQKGMMDQYRRLKNQSSVFLGACSFVLSEVYMLNLMGVASENQAYLSTHLGKIQDDLRQLFVWGPYVALRTKIGNMALTSILELPLSTVIVCCENESAPL